MGNPISPPEDPYTYEDLLADKSEKLTRLGPDCCFQWITGSWSEGRRIGIIFWHRARDNRACGGLVSFERAPSEQDRPVWTVESWDPLTISPSVLCNGSNGCGGFHGWIRNGAWQPA